MAVVREVFEREAFLGVDDQRAGRNLDDQVLGAFALLVRAAAWRAGIGPPEAMMGEGGQIVDAVFGDDDHAAAGRRRRRRRDRRGGRIFRAGS